MCAEYNKRLSRFCKLSIVELAEKRIGDNPSDTEIQKALDAEGEAMLRAVPEGAFKIAMCIEGRSSSSEALAVKMAEGMSRSGKVAFFIGSSHGMSEKVKKQCDMRFSMSELTFPHQLARCMLLEQIYRSYKIRNKEAYHK
jgi:23S rRNA (pseudouridine1915-N3)-methyltransferase